MTGSSEHDRVRELLEAEALDALTGDEHARLAEHLAECAECRRELGALRDTAATLGGLRSGPPLDAERTARVRTRLLARVAADATPSRPDIRPAAAVPRAGRWAGWMVAAGMAALLVTHHTFHQTLKAGWLWTGVFAFIAVGLGSYAVLQRDRVALLRAELGTPGGAAAVRTPSRTPWLAAAVLAALFVGAGAYALQLREREAALAGLVAPATRVIELAAASPRAPYGRMFWNPATDRWTFFAYDLPPAAPGRTYQLWLVTPGDPVSAGTFEPGADGRATVRAEYALPPERLQAIAVTEEPAGGVPAPTGPMVIVGSASE